MDNDAVILRNKKDSKRIRQCRVVFSYKQDHEDELNLNVGDVIDILGEEEEGWWKGILNGKIGVFPSNFVEEIPSKKDETSDIDNPSKTAKILCEVKYSYKAQNEDELSLNEGDIVTLLSKDGQDPGWWKGQLNGMVGVFPDNFVVILPECSGSDAAPIKPSSIALQRKSLENRDDKTPPVTAKKPSLVKKSPSSSAITNVFSGIKKKLADAVDGATGSKAPKEVENSENVFDQVERVPLLTDVRATRAKAPAGRRPPSVVFRDDETSSLPNGTAIVTDPPPSLDAVVENHSPPPAPGDATDAASEAKPKLREWEKHKAPWLAEMKLNQAKRSSTSPLPRADDAAAVEERKESPTSPPQVKPKPVAPAPAKPPVAAKATTPPPPARPDGEPIAFRQYAELVERVHKLELLVEKQGVMHATAIEELKGKLQLETEMRHMLQVQLEKIGAQAQMQV